MIRVSGRSVTSVRNGSPSTSPRSKTDSCCEIGNSGLVMVVGSVNVGIAVSTRSPSGARGRSPRTDGCGIVAGVSAEGVVADGVAVVGVASGLAVHAPTSEAAATMARANRSCRTGPVGLSVSMRIRSSSVSSGQQRARARMNGR